MVQDTRLIELKGVCKNFGDTQVLHDVDLYIRKCEFITLLGPSGCGKTTLLRIIGGFEMPSSGEVLFEGSDLTAIPPYKALQAPHQHGVPEVRAVQPPERVRQHRLRPEPEDPGAAGR